MREQGTGNRGKRTAVLLLGVVSMALSVLAFAPIPKESAKALKVTRGKPFSSGAVFINGKYLEPPYVVERWGTGIRINGKQVTNQVIDWTEFIKTQRDFKIEKPESSGAAQQETAPDKPKPAPVEPKPPSAESEDVTADSLDSLFDDEPKQEKPVADKKAAEPEEKPRSVAAAAKPKPAATTYTLTGDFVSNRESKEKLNRINKLRTKIDTTLRVGGFICFGDRYYSPSPDDSRMVQTLLEELPELQKNARSENDFIVQVGKSSLGGLFDEAVRKDLYRHRVDYRKLQERREKMKRDGDLQKMLNGAAAPLF